MQIEIVVVSPFQQNCHLLICEETRAAVIIDAGDEAQKILRAVKSLAISPKYLLATHGHIDHVAAVATVQETLGIPFYMHRDDVPLVEIIPAKAAMFHMPESRLPKIDGYLKDGDRLTFGKCAGQVLHTPGHSPGNISFLFGRDLFCGDLLFAGNVGRTDLPGGSLSVLKRSLRDKILTLAYDTRVFPGHGPTTTVGEEASWLLDFVEE